jgi:N-dimethylarginine dimethylaminohydrolase
VAKSRLLVCRSQDFKVDYSINPWMHPGTSDPEHAVTQWQSLVGTLTELAEVEVAEFPADAPQELIWTRDAFIVHDKRIILANFKHEVRRAETPFYKQWFEDHGYSVEQSVGTMEGGNTIRHNGRYYVGTGIRAEASDCDALAKQLNTEVVPLPVTGDQFFHIDLAFLSLDEHNAFYYRPAFSPEAVKTLQSRIKNLHELSEPEMNGYCANSITIGDHVIVQADNPTFKQRLEALGKQVHEVDLSEFKNIGGGGVHCLTNVLE